MVIIIADCHLNAGTEGEADFFALLDRIATTDHDVCFDGDIMELWLGLDGYETDLHRRFIAWCLAEKERRKVYFIEGNHEFFAASHHRDAFSEISSESLKIGKLLVCHGDGLPGQNWRHRIFRSISKSWMAEFLAKYLPGARSLVRHIKHRFEEAARHRDRHVFQNGYLYPETKEAIENWRQRNSEGEDAPKMLFLGHFHCEYLSEGGDFVPACVLPVWRDSRRFAVVDPESGEYTITQKI